ncbi:uncharacterized protein LOC128219093 [Mya arenaria]|uniref:uncharacterized protein LOC128219093 n=1 Tax=Mya arenaria TaxID=6604 RepID=UPI0022E75B09|nr:uncharacterized protein LOC128219093 [Mya arenaria]
MSHQRCIVYNIEYEIDLKFEDTYEELRDFIGFLYENETKIDNFVYTFRPTEKHFNVHVSMPHVGAFRLQLYGRRIKDGPNADFRPIVKYILQCTKSLEEPIPYPTYHSLYGPMKNLENFGVENVDDKVYHESENGEIIFSLKPAQLFDIFPRLHFHDHTIAIKGFCFVDYSDCGQYINVIVRMRYEGHYKLILFGKKEKSLNYTPFTTYLIKCTKACKDGIFPEAHEYALKYKCCLLEPLSMHHPPKSDVFFCIKSLCLKSVRYVKNVFTQSNDGSFEFTIRTPSEDLKVVIDGCGSDGVFHSLYSYTTVILIDF